VIDQTWTNTIYKELSVPKEFNEKELYGC
jgi:hypothetical protein